MIKILSLLIFVMALGACSPLSSNEPQTATYILNPVTFADDAHVGLAKTYLIAVDTVRVAPDLRGDRIAVLKGERERDYYATARWNANLSDTIRSVMAESLENKFGPVVVHPDDHRIHPKYVLQIDIRDFQAEYDSPSADTAPNIRIGMTAYLIDDETRTTMQRLKIEKTARAEANTLTAVTGTFDTLTKQAATEIITKLAAGKMTSRKTETGSTATF